MGQRILRITNQFFPHLFSGEKHYRVTSDAIPANARVTHATLDYTGQPGNNDVIFVLESSEWSDVPHGQPLPDIMPVMRTIQDDNDH